jgi:Ca2+:H+ antiporter
VVQASLIGSILANLLLILGMAFLLGGLRFREQVSNYFGVTKHLLTLHQDLQQYHHSNEYSSSQLERDESPSSGMWTAF